MIKIISSQTYVLENGAECRSARIAASNGGGSVYLLNVGGLPASGTLQDILDARDTELFTMAQARGVVLPIGDSAKLDAKAFLIAYPAAKNIIKLSLPDLLTAIDNRTAAQETLLLKTIAVAVRYLYEQEKMT